jgi:outer membrane lipoprotein-sorting protein
MTLTAIPLLLATLVAAPPAMAGGGDAQLAQVDAAINAAKDASSDVTAETVIPGKKPVMMAFTLQTAGEKRRVQFSSPGDMKGTRVVVMSPKQMYVYLPAYNKIRRVASHANNQGFMGTMFADADMSTTHYGALYQAEVVKEEAAVLTLSLTPKEGEKTAYGRIEMDVMKPEMVPQTLRYFNGKGQHVKTEERSDWYRDDGIVQPQILKMIDHTRGDAYTVLNQKVTGVNEGLGDDLFSQRALQQGW